MREEPKPIEVLRRSAPRAFLPCACACACAGGAGLCKCLCRVVLCCAVLCCAHACPPELPLTHSLTHTYTATPTPTPHLTSPPPTLPHPPCPSGLHLRSHASWSRLSATCRQCHTCMHAPSPTVFADNTALPGLMHTESTIYHLSLTYLLYTSTCMYTRTTHATDSSHMYIRTAPSFEPESSNIPYPCIYSMYITVPSRLPLRSPARVPTVRPIRVHRLFLFAFSRLFFVAFGSPQSTQPLVLQARQHKRRTPQHAVVDQRPRDIVLNTSSASAQCRPVSSRHVHTS